MFNLKWTGYLKQAKISDETVLDGNNKALLLIEKAKTEHL
jgi:hypothetical protein